MKKLKVSLISLTVLCMSIIITAFALVAYGVMPWWFMIVAGLGAISYEIMKFEEWFGFDYEEENSK